MTEPDDEGSDVCTDVGQVIAGKYELVKLLGKGAMGEVWLATHNTLGGEFAIKIVEPTDDIEAETAAGRFQLEAQIAAKLSRRTRHIVSVSDHGEENGLAYLVMERLEGESLETRLARTGPLSLPEVAAMVSQVSRALSVAHEEGIFHRDLKPANIWLGQDEDGRLLVKLLDFGIARSSKPFRTRSPFATSKDMVLGTPSYMSPEQARGLDSLDYRCDLWALAVAAYEGLAGCIPFEGTTVEDVFLAICTFKVVPLRTYRTDLGEVEPFFERAFAEQIDHRFQTASELSAVFEQLVDPEEMFAALGFPPAPVSRPRLPSNPDFAVPDTRPRLPSNSDLTSSGSGLAFNVDRAVANAPIVSELDDITLPAPEEEERPRRSAAGWVLALVAIFALSAGLFAFVMYRADRPVSAAPPPTGGPPPVTGLVPAETANPSPVSPPAQPVAAPPAPAEEPTPKVVAPVTHGKAPAVTKPSAPLHPAPGPQAAPVPAVHPAAPPSARTPAPAKTVNKSEIL